MAVLKEININYDQICELVNQLDFKKKIDLLGNIIKDKRYKSDFYKFTNILKKRHSIPDMTEEELDDFLHDDN